MWRLELVVCVDVGHEYTCAQLEFQTAARDVAASHPRISKNNRQQDLTLRGCCGADVGAQQGESRLDLATRGTVICIFAVPRQEKKRRISMNIGGRAEAMQWSHRVIRLFCWQRCWIDNQGLYQSGKRDEKRQLSRVALIYFIIFHASEAMRCLDQIYI